MATVFLIPRLLPVLLAVLLVSSPALAIRNGEVSRAQDGVRKHVVQIIGPSGTKCSGTAIARRLVVTAAHCFLAGPGTYRIRLLSPRFRFRVATAAQVAIHPGFDASAFDRELPLNDVAMLALADDLPDWIVPAPLSRSSLRSGSPELVLVAGYGMDRERAVGTAGTLRQARLSTDGGYDSQTRTFLLVDRRNRKPERLAGVCRGDSGGPVFRETAKGYELVGIISAVIAGDRADCGVVTTVIPVALHLDYITSTARQAGIAVAIN